MKITSVFIVKEGGHIAQADAPPKLPLQHSVNVGDKSLLLYGGARYSGEELAAIIDEHKQPEPKK